MGKSIKSKIARLTNDNPKLNQKALIIKKSWDEVAALLNAVSKPKN